MSRRPAVLVVACLLALGGLIALILVTRADHHSPAHVATKSGDASPLPIPMVGSTTTTSADPSSSESSVASSETDAPAPSPTSEESSESEVDSSTTSTVPAAVPIAPDAILALYPYGPGGGEIVAVNPDGSGSNVLLRGEFWAATWGPNHAAVAWIDAAQSELHVFTLGDGSDRVLVPAGDPMSPYRPSYDPRWSPDGRTIAYACSGMCTVDVATGATHELVSEMGLQGPDDHSANDNPPEWVFGSWSPDSRYFSYSMIVSDENGNLTTTPRIADTATGEHRDLAEGIAAGGLFHLLFTADGRSVFWHRSGWVGRNYCACQTVLVPVDGGDMRDVPGVGDDPIDRSPSGDEFLSNGVFVGDLSRADVFRLDGSTRQVDVGNRMAASW